MIPRAPCAAWQRRCGPAADWLPKSPTTLSPKQLIALTLAEVFDSCNRKRIEFTSAAGITDLRFGKVLPIYMDALGLVEMGNEGVARMVHGGDVFSRMWIQTWQRIDDVVIAKGILTESEVADMRRAYKDPTFTYRAQLMQSVWGRRRSQQS